MEVKVGDKVKFMNDVGGGIVVKINDKDTATVRTEDDWEIPVLKKELLVVAAAEEEAITSKIKANKSNDTLTDEDFEQDDIAPELNENDELNMYFAFVPKNPVNAIESDLDAYLINDSNYYVLYNVLMPEKHLYAANVGKLEPNTSVLVKTISRNKIKELPKLIFQLIFYKNIPFDRTAPVEKKMKLNTVKFFKQKSYKENDFFDEPSIVYPVIEEQATHKFEDISEEDIKKVIAEKEIKNASINQPKHFSKKVDPTTIEEVVDLHIHELLDDFSKLSPKEIIEYQMNKFREALEDAISRRIKSITFIHGIGNGTLKYELRGELEKKYKRYTYQDASFKEYGFGATMVVLRGK